MKQILCFGDSNTYGYAPFDGRYDASVRWVDRLEVYFAGEYRMIHAGLNGRTIGRYNSIWPELNGIDVIGGYLERYQPLHMIILMLGANDAWYDSAEDICVSMRQFLHIIKEHPQTVANHTHVLLVAPPSCNEPGLKETLVRIGPAYRALTQEMQLNFVDTADWQIDLAEDGCHFSPQGHASFAAYLYDYINTNPNLR